ncbi:MAG: acyltransferase [Anaerotruncus sp.]|nr:acyltransferase [Anaerotruncus sp.]
MRKPFVDNLRGMAVLLLFPVHTFMVWNDFGSGFYIWAGADRRLSTCIVLINPWLMPLLFVLAGISARYALQTRTVKAFVVQRTRRLLLPFIVGTAVLAPLQTWYARRYFDHYEGGIRAHWSWFFTHLTDLSGYDGAFTPGHLWFILFLFLISLAALPVLQAIPYEKCSEFAQKIPVPAILLLFIPVWLMYHLGNFNGFSIGKYFTLYLIGYYLLSNDTVTEKLEQHKNRMIWLWGIGTAVSAVLYGRFSYYGDVWVNLTGWISVLALLILGKTVWNRRSGFTVFAEKCSYQIYLLHLPILVAAAYHAAGRFHSVMAQVLSIWMGSLVLTVSACLLLKRIFAAAASRSRRV